VEPKGTPVARWNPDGGVRWQLDNMADHNPNMAGCCDTSDDVPPPPGKAYAFRGVVGTAHDALIANDYDGGWNGDINAITYVWDGDGLWAASFEDVDTSEVPREYDSLSSDNRSGDLAVGPCTGDVVIHGARDTDFNVFRVSGWGGWLRLSGELARP
jgi:hypothetical protein